MQGDDDDDYDEDDETMRISLNVSNALHLHAVGAQHTVSGGDGVFWRIAPLEMSMCMCAQSAATAMVTQGNNRGATHNLFDGKFAHTHRHNS